MHHHFHFNFLAILVAALIQFFLGALWYSLFFAKPWMELTGHTKGERPKGIVVAMFSSFVGSLLLPFMLAHMVIGIGADSFGMGAFIGFLCWLGFIVPTFFAETIYERRPYKLYAINVGYWLAVLIISGGLLGAWR